MSSIICSAEVLQNGFDLRLFGITWLECWRTQLDRPGPDISFKGTQQVLEDLDEALIIHKLWIDIIDLHQEKQESPTLSKGLSDFGELSGG